MAGWRIELMNAVSRSWAAPAICMLAALSACPVGSEALADDWPQWRGPNRDGKSAETGLLKSWPSGGPKRLWKVTGIGRGYSGPAVAGGRIFITGLAGRKLVIKALDLGGGTLWRKVHGPGWTDEMRYPGSRATPTVDGERVYLFSGKGLVSCYRVKDGSRLWSVDVTKAFGGDYPQWGYAESVLVHGDLAVVSPGGRNCIVALDKTSGRAVWKSRGLNDPVHYSSCIAFEFNGARLIANLTGKGLVCVNAADGRFLWRNDRAAGRVAVCPTPVYSDGYVFAASGYNNGGVCQRLSLRGRQLFAEEAWQTRDMDCHHGGYVVVDGHIYGNHKNGWNCLELKTGRKKWSAIGVGKGSVCYADGMLYTFAERRGRIGLVPASPERFSLVSEFSVAGSGPSWAHPVIAGGRLYLRYGDNLYAFDVRAGSSLSACGSPAQAGGQRR
jgi:outer membrane protein assembly factor BamB